MQRHLLFWRHPKQQFWSSQTYFVPPGVTALSWSRALWTTHSASRWKHLNFQKSAEVVSVTFVQEVVIMVTREPEEKLVVTLCVLDGNWEQTEVLIWMVVGEYCAFITWQRTYWCPVTNTRKHGVKGATELMSVITNVDTSTCLESYAPHPSGTLLALLYCQQFSAGAYLDC